MADIITGEAVVVDVPYARFGSRLAAIAIDLVIQVVVLSVIALLLLRAAGSVDPAAVAATGLAMFVFVIVGYPAIFETVTRGRSPGKLALGLRVVSENGGPERFRQALLRALAGVLEFWLLQGCPALICSLLSAKGKRLGDVFAGTVVIQERMPARGGPVAMMPPALASWAAGLELSGLPDQTAAMARQYLARFHELSPAARAELGYRLATAVAATVSPPPPPGTAPPDYLSAVLAERRSRAWAQLPGGAPAPGWPAPGGWPAPPQRGSAVTVTPPVTATVTPPVTATVTPPVTATVTPPVTATVTPPVTAPTVPAAPASPVTAPPVAGPWVAAGPPPGGAGPGGGTQPAEGQQPLEGQQAARAADSPPAHQDEPGQAGFVPPA